MMTLENITKKIKVSNQHHYKVFHSRSSTFRLPLHVLLLTISRHCAQQQKILVENFYKGKKIHRQYSEYKYVIVKNYKMINIYEVYSNHTPMYNHLMKGLGV